MRLQIRFELEIPDDMPLDAAKEWIAFEVGARCDMTHRHPQMDRDLAPVPGTFTVKVSAMSDQPEATDLERSARRLREIADRLSSRGDIPDSIIRDLRAAAQGMEEHASRSAAS